MLVIYTIIFSVFFNLSARPGTGTKFYSLFLFCGMVPWIAFSQAISQSSIIILGNVNLVKRTVFPLEILPVVSTLSGLVHSLFGLFILLVGIIVLQNQFLHVTSLFLILIFIPQVLFTAGLSWFLASLGVFIRDIGNSVSVLLLAWMYMTPIMYPSSMVPEKVLPYMNLNPMKAVVDNYRRVLIYGEPPDWNSMFLLSLFSIVIAVLGYIWFMKCKKAFADVL